jgi:type I restriction enzyme S subunit
MNADRLLRLYERISDAPDAVARLRRFVLDLAVRGKLMPQHPNDEPASELLKRSAAEKARLVKMGEIKASKPLQPLDDDAEFDVPPNWQWTRLGVVTTYIQRGKSPKYTASNGALVVSQKCVQWTGLDLTVAKQVTLASLADYEPVRFLRDGDLLWNSTGTGTIGRVIRLVEPPKKLVCDSHVTVVRCLEVDPEYVRTWLRSDQVYGQVEDRAAGSTNQVELTAQMAINQIVPLPPLAEQKRIVAKVDELMALCDQLDKARIEREAMRDRLAAASLARLNEPNPETFHDDARFALDALPAMTARPDQIKRLRETILNLAVQGKLVPQTPEDEPASELMKRIEKERQERAKGSRGTKPPSELERVSLVHSAGWSSATMSELAIFENGDRSSNYPSGSDILGSGIPFFSTKNLADYKLGFSSLDFISEKKFASLRSGKLQDRDILITLRGSVGKFGLFRATEEYRTGFINAQLLIVRSLVPELVDFFITFMKSEAFSTQLDTRSSGSATPQLSGGQLAQVVIPIPPLAEQRRIVAKVNELMALCDRLEASLTAGEDARSRLLDALLHEALDDPLVDQLEAAG